MTSQVETNDLGPDGQFRPGVKISFQLDDGTVGSVFLPDRQYSADNARLALAAKAAELSAVSAMTHES